ncbi:MAG: helix-turn-helix transcriptional regulator [Candidatus Peregrinibacteria bacterium]|nr:helix-turn-helix transcriptional regulator [Candidatus Peregrinibacteria bacterium]
MDEESKVKLGKRIKSKREELGLSQSELANSVNKSSAAYIAFIEAGDRNVSAMDLMLIAKRLGVTVASLLGEDSNDSPKVMEALRADKELSKKDREKVEEYYNFIKNKGNDK